MKSFVALFKSLIIGVFRWSIDEYNELINYFFNRHKIDNERDVSLFCALYLTDTLASKPYVSFDSGTNTFKVSKTPEKGSIALIKGSKIDSIIKTIEEAKKRFNIINGSPTGPGMDDVVPAIVSKMDHNSCSALVQQVLDYIAVEDNEKSAILDFYKKKLKSAFYYLMKSLLVGEYLILDDYIDILESCNQEVDAHKADFQGSNSGEYIPPFESFIENSYHAIKRAYSTIMDSLAEPGKGTKYTFYIGAFGNHRYDNDYKLTDEEKYQLAIEALVHVILIDHIFITTPQNIDTLHWAAHIIDRIPGKTVDHQLQDVCVPLLNKIYLMMRQMIEDKSEEPELQTEFRFGEDSIKSVVESRFFTKDASEPFPFDNEGLFREFCNFDTDINNIDWSCNTPYEGVNKYNKFVDNNHIIRRDKHQKIRKCIKENDVSIFGVLEAIAADPNGEKCLSTSILYQAIRFVDNKVAIDKDISFIRKHELITFLLNKLEPMVQSYSSCKIIPQKFFLPFKSSFFFVDEKDKDKNALGSFKDVDYEGLEDTVSLFEGKPVILFLAAGLKPTNINFLSRFVDRQKKKTNKQYLDFLLEQEVRVTDRVKDLDSLQEDLEHQKNTNLQLVGYLGSFIAFVAVAANALKSTSSNADEMKQMLTTITCSILCFAVMIRVITLPKDDVLKDRLFSLLISFGLAVTMLILIARVLV